ncbi:ABC transporter permease [Xanthocytophaga agilis]|uniref:ABC transporter permease n=1 Tax=Xanthocytophaga agilis TaxID=3048010 RepID=A0AAE3R6B8_9BACT|nr:ABC transporter permease [Xanthocytophaga agilis]MDJ1501487.1 ABC transporter permease [Xanthocytophaga agilis]
MLKNLLQVAFRNLTKDKGFSLLNILGLTIGITFSLFLLFYIRDELNFDRYHTKADHIYRIITHLQEPERTDHVAITQFVLAPALKKEYPEVEQAVRFVGKGRTLLKNGEQHLFEDKIFFADSNLFEVFTYPFLEGDPKTALLAPNSILLTETLAKKLFSTTKDLTGKSLQTSNGTVYKITGILQDIPLNSHIRFNALLSVSTLPKDFGNNWGNFGFFTYVLLNPAVNPSAFEKKLLPMYDKYMASIFAPFNVKMHYGVQPITDIHLHSTLNGEPEELGSMSYIYTFSIVAVFMLLIASINYMNLTTARSARRAKEIGIRKVAGSTQFQLILQFLTESIVLTFVSFIVSIVFIFFLIPVFNTLSGKLFKFSTLFHPFTFLSLIGIIVLVGLIGGSYPAFYLAKFNPVSVLKGSLAKGSSNIALRRVLVVMQFSISMIMLICTWIVYDQLQFLRTKDLGYDKEQVMVINLNQQGDVKSKLRLLQNELRKNSQIIDVSTSNATPGSDASKILFEIESKNGFTNYASDIYGIDPFYLKTLGIKLVEGRNFTETDQSDTLRRAIVNEAMLKQMGWQEALGKKIRFAGDTANTMEVIGVVKDFHQRSLYNPIEPLILVYRQNNNTIQVKVSNQNIPATVGYVEKQVKSVFPDEPFQYTFLDQDFTTQFAADQRRGQIFTAFSSLTILIACLGLLGLVAFTTQQRQKEISIRKILGAETGNLFLLINKNFLLLIGVACIISFPVSYYFMHQWLSTFPYRTPLKPETFIISSLVILLITLLTVSYHTIRAALSNPVNALRSE